MRGSYDSTYSFNTTAGGVSLVPSPGHTETSSEDGPQVIESCQGGPGPELESGSFRLLRWETEEGAGLGEGRGRGERSGRGESGCSSGLQQAGLAQGGRGSSVWEEALSGGTCAV